MKLYSKKHPERWIKVLSKRNRIQTTRGFAVITATSEYVDQTIRPDLLEQNYTLPKGTIIED